MVEAFLQPRILQVILVTRSPLVQINVPHYKLLHQTRFLTRLLFKSGGILILCESSGVGGSGFQNVEDLNKQFIQTQIHGNEISFLTIHGVNIFLFFLLMCNSSVELKISVRIKEFYPGSQNRHLHSDKFCPQICLCQIEYFLWLSQQNSC